MDGCSDGLFGEPVEDQGADGGPDGGGGRGGEHGCRAGDVREVAGGGGAGDQGERIRPGDGRGGQAQRASADGQDHHQRVSNCLCMGCHSGRIE